MNFERKQHMIQRTFQTRGQLRVRCRTFAFIVLCVSGFVTAADLSMSLPDIIRKADQGDAHAQLALGIEHENGNQVVKDRAKAAAWYLSAAEQGLAEAQFRLGILGDPAPPERMPDWDAIKDWQDRSKIWFRKAAAQGHVKAQYELAKLMEPRSAANDEPKDFLAQERVKWFSSAAELGCAEAQYELGLLLIEGIRGDSWEMPADKEGAMKWLFAAAQQKHVEAQFFIGRCYSTGRAVPKDDAEAVRWTRSAAESGTGKDKYQLGVMYEMGTVVPRDEYLAREWYQKGAEEEDGDCQLKLASIYLIGTAVPTDKAEAYKWFLLASGNEQFRWRKRALTQAHDYERSLTAVDIAEGQRRARAFKPNSPQQRQQTNLLPSPLIADLTTNVGTGFFISEDGFFVTAAHVSSGAKVIEIVTPSGLLQARLVAQDVSNDLALLKIAGQFAALPIASSRKVRLGESVATVGFPNVELQGRSPKLARGEIAGLSGVHDDPRLFQVSVPLQPGNSGGPLVDQSGNVIGVVLARIDNNAAVLSSGVSAENVNYALKSSLLIAFLESLPSIQVEMATLKTGERAFTDVVSEVEKASFMVKASR